MSARLVVPVLLCGVLALPAGVWGQAQSPLLVNVVDDIRVVRIDGRGNQRTLLDGDPARIWYRSTRADPFGQSIAVLRTSDPATRAQRNRLLVIDTAGRTTRTLRHDVREYAWCCGGQAIAVITGRYREAGRGFRAESAFVVDVRSGAERAIRLPRPPVDVSWGAFDQAVYFGLPTETDSLSVWRFDPLSGATTETPYRGMKFSPSGNYYLYMSYLAPPGWHLVNRATGREIATPDTALGEIKGWAFGQGDYLLLEHYSHLPDVGRIRTAAEMASRTTFRYAIYDVNRGRVVQRGLGRIPSAASAPAGFLPVMRNGRMESIRRPAP